MKKTLIYIAALGIAATATIACDDYLDEPVNGQQTLDSYFVTEDEATSYLNGCYNALTFYGWWQIQNFWIMTDMCSDDMWMGNLSQSQSDYYSLAHYQGVGQSNGPLENYWMHRYKGIMQCNVAINRIPNAHFQDTEKQNRFIAEAKFLRAYYYFELVRNFGAVPIVDDFLMPDEIEGITRSPVDTVYARIEKDLKDAAKGLPSKKEYSSSDLGRATSGAAKGLLGKVYVYEEKWSEAKQILGEVIDSKEYDLMADFGDVWNVDTNNNDESLFEVQTCFNETYALGNALSVVSANRTEVNDGWAWGLPTSDLEQAFLDENDSIRLKWTIIKTGATEIAGEPDFDELVADQYAAQSNQHKDMIEGTYYISPEVHKSARVSRKLYIPYKKRPSKWSQDYIPLDIRLLRFADILLLYAEASNNLGQDDDALTALNRVRKRVNRPDLTCKGTELTQAIRTERRLELALEYNRLYDIRRWESLKNPGHKVIADILGPNGSFVKRNTNAATADPYEYAATKEPSNKGETFDESRDLLFPIPLYEIQHSNGTIEQNPGWN